MPYSKEFDGRLAVIAFAYEPSAEGYDAGYITDARHILYPQDRELKLDVDFEQNTYRPGEEASARLTALASDGRPLESVLGVVVFDKAVEERARTDQEFSSAYGFDNYFSSFWYGSGDIGGITLRDIERLDPVRRRVPDGMDLVAEILLQESDEERYTPARFDLPELEKNQGEVFSSIISKQFRPVRETLDAHYKGTANYPADGESLRRLLNQTGINLDSLRDPWGMTYRTKFFVDKSMDVIEIKSAGADKRFDTADDFAAAQFGWPYFRRLGEKIDAALEDYHARTGRTVRDAATLREELERAGLSDDALRDRWGHPYQFTFGAQETLVSVNIQSPGPNGRFEPEQDSTDDFIVWTNWTDSFADMKTAIANALEDYLKTTSRFPQNEAQFAESLTRAGIERQALRDPWGRAYLVNFQSGSRLTARAVMETAGSYGEKPKESLTVIPMSERVYTVRLLSLGEDGRGTTNDDFTAATFTSVGGEGADSTQRRARQAYVFSGSSGAINGVVTDAMGAVVPGAEVLAIHKYTSLDFSIRTDDEGRFTLLNLPSGYYTLTVHAPGFQRYVITDLPVTTAKLTKLDIVINVANITETVTVTAGGETTVNATSATIGSEIKRGATGQTQMSTPRLREYFPETLVWQPALETDVAGRTELRFKLADNITTWKVSVIGSTVDGMIGTAEKEIRAFQPFFVEHDPPRVLTEGDEIHLPVVLRNYLDKRQTVNLEIKPESWFTMTGADAQSAEVEANDATRATFEFRAVSSVKDGKQRITARGNDASDAIEKPVTVHPDGEERVATVGRIFSDRAVVNTDIPADALDGTLGGELKIYPNLMGHVIESIEGIMKRPYGCGEQTISSTYPSLMVLMGYSRNGARPPATIRNKAELYLGEGYKRLLTYRTAGGGFSYWGGASAEADIALTAYALRFLLDARSIMEVDEDIIKSAAAWLVQQQNADGSWSRIKEAKAKAARQPERDSASGAHARTHGARGREERERKRNRENRGRGSSSRAVVSRAAHRGEPRFISTRPLMRSQLLTRARESAPHTPSKPCALSHATRTNGATGPLKGARPFTAGAGREMWRRRRSRFLRWRE